MPRRGRLHPIVPITIALGVLTVVAGLLTWLWDPKRTVATGAPKPSVSTTTTSLKTSSTVPPSSTTVARAPATTVALAANGLKAYPPGGVYDGGRPPQFVLVSFDGAADPALLERWMKVSKEAQARVTLFLSVVHLLSVDHAERYQGPKHNPGESDIGFARNGDQPATTWIGKVIGGLQLAQRDGFELGMNFGGHWCGPEGINTWTAADWTAELEAVNAIAENADAWNGLNPALGNVYTSPPIGARTPCLEGREAEYSPPLKALGYRYNASNTRGIDQWPVFRNDLWNFGFPGVPIRGYPRDMITVDAAIHANLVPGEADPTDERAKQISKDVYDGLMAGFESSFYGNRAPFEVANRFTSLGKGAYDDAVETFMLSVCRRPEVHCVTYREMTDWLDLQFERLGRFQTGEFVKAVK